jgi:hypothetical protein
MWLSEQLEAQPARGMHTGVFHVSHAWQVTDVQRVVRRPLAWGGVFSSDALNVVKVVQKERAGLADGEHLAESQPRGIRDPARSCDEDEFLQALCNDVSRDTGVDPGTWRDVADFRGLSLSLRGASSSDSNTVLTGPGAMVISPGRVIVEGMYARITTKCTLLVSNTVYVSEVSDLHRRGKCRVDKDDLLALYDNSAWRGTSRFPYESSLCHDHCHCSCVPHPAVVCGDACGLLARPLPRFAFA